MTSPSALGAALAATVLPSPLGWFSLLAALLLGGRPLELTGLALLALAAGAPAPEEAAGPATRGAVVLEGRWRVPPGGPAHLETAGGPVGVRLAADLARPSPGAWVRLAARFDSRGRAEAVATLDVGPVAGAWLDRWAAAAERRVDALVGPSRRGLVKALLLGRREELSHALAWSCVVTGTAHLLALSGLHVVLVGVTARRLLRGQGRLGPASEALTLVLFVALAGARPPLVRAGLTRLVAAVGAASGHGGSGLRRLAAVALVMAVWSPGLFEQLSAQLSFLAVAGLMAAHRLARGRGLALVAPLGAFLATAPLCAERFGRVQPMGVLLTPFLVPLVGAILAVGLVAVLPRGLFGALDGLAAPALDGTARGLEAGLTVAARWFPEPLTPPPLPVPGLLASLVVVAALLLLAPSGPPRREGWVL